jgi:hypothetical protein
VYLNKFVKNVPILTGLITATGLIITYLLFDTSHKTNVAMFTLQTTDRGLINIYESFNANYEKCPNFIRSLDFNFNTSSEHYENSYDAKENSIAIANISIKIFHF